MRDFLDLIDARRHPADAGPLVALVARLRPARAADAAAAEHGVRALAQWLGEDPARARTVRHYLSDVLAARQHRYLLADTGVVRPEGLWRGLLGRLQERWLPQVPHDAYLRDLFRQMFAHRDDAQWLQQVPLDAWRALWRASGIADEPSLPGFAQMRDEALEAMHMLAVRLHAAATDNEVVRLHSDEPYDLGPFDRLLDRVRVEVGREVGEVASGDATLRTGEEPGRALADAIVDVEREIAQWRRLLRRHGTTAALAQRRLAAGQMLARLRALAQIHAVRDADERFERGLRLFQKLVEAQQREASLTDLWARTTNLLALRITEQAGRTGEHYVAHGRSQWAAMLRAALGAGVIVGAMALAKIGITAMHLPPAWHALAVSLNYAAGFVLVHLLHFTIATKQPAMTAALIASTVRTDRRGDRSLSRLADLIVAIVRTQMVAIAGNVLAAFPTALGLYYLLGALPGDGLIDADKAAHLLADLDPVASLALPHAAIAGVCLYLAGVASGY
jgi:site-specific recombinase